MAEISFEIVEHIGTLSEGLEHWLFGFSFGFLLGSAIGVL